MKEKAIRATDDLKDLMDNYTFGDAGNAELFVSIHQRRVRFNIDKNTWVVFDNGVWSDDKNENMVLGLTSKVSEMLREFADNAQDMDSKSRFEKCYKLSMSASARKNMLKLAAAQSKIYIKNKDFNSHPNLLNLQNGTIDLKSGRILKHNPNDFVTHKIDIPFSRNAKCPLWQKFILQIANGDRRLAAYIERVLGYAVTGETREQCLFILVGNGANGKSTLLNVMQDILGSYAKKANSSLLLRKKYDQHPTSIAYIHDCRFAVCVESNRDDEFSESILKEITGEDVANARFMHRDEFQFKPEVKLFIGTNAIPRTRDNSDAFRRRVRIIPFNASFKNKPNLDLKRALLNEREGILRRLIESAQRYYESGLKEPIAVSNAARTYFVKADPVEQFLREECELNGGRHVRLKTSDLTERFQKWSDEVGQIIVSSRKLHEAMRDRGFRTIKSNDVYYLGIRFKK